MNYLHIGIAVVHLYECAFRLFNCLLSPVLSPTMELENNSPSVFKKLEERTVSCFDQDDDVADPFDTREIFGKYSNRISFILRSSNRN